MMNISPSAPAKAVMRKAWLSAWSSWSPVHSHSTPGGSGSSASSHSVSAPMRSLALTGISSMPSGPSTAMVWPAVMSALTS